MPVVRKFLDLSTAHLSREDTEALDSFAEEGSTKGPLTSATPYGWFMYASEEPEIDPDLTPNLLKIVEYARKHDCVYVLFDADAEVDEALPVFETEDA